MKKTNTLIAISILSATFLVSTGASAEDALTEIKPGLGFGGGAIAGLVMGGPVGMFAGALTGVYFGEQLQKADALPATEQAFQAASVEAELLETEVQQYQARIAFLETELRTEIAANDETRLEFQMMFRTGEDLIQEQDQSRIDMLAGYLQRNPELRVRLDGHADPRGSDEYNNVLAKFRALSVANALYEKGIAEERVQVHFHGADQSDAVSGDYESYALERRVNIEVYKQPASGLAQGH
jgi:outer membrane protein OmpA-like peptidoglycan-associated protein